MKMTKRQFLITAMLGILGMAFGRFLKALRPSDGRRASYWRRADRLAG